MLTLVEKILFVAAVLSSLYFTWIGVRRIIRIISRGQGKPDWSLAWKRLWEVALKVGTFRPLFRFRLGPSLLHLLIGWGFLYFLLVNLAELLQGFIPNYRFLQETGALGDFYRLLADISTLAVLVGIVGMVIRRFILRPAALSTRESTLLDPRARRGIKRDSAIVASFVILHVLGRLLSESIFLAGHGPDAWQPFATTVAGLWSGMSEGTRIVLEHIGFWFSLGSIVAFLPYFPYTKHIHLFFTPINYLLKPERKSIGELNYVNFEDESIEQFGATNAEHLGWEQLMDSYACIMCFRCQEVCPAYNTGKVLSPAALEINKRYYFNREEGTKFASGEESKPLLEFAINEEAVWACTSCGACVDICPVGNEPMRDILDIRRSLVLMENNFPKQWENAFKGMERNTNPWNVSQAERMKWAEGLDVPTIEQNPEPEILWWVGCAPATDARAQKTAQAFAKILNASGLNYAVLGQNEQCTGDSARRAGNEYLFFELATANVEILNEVKPPRIVTTCPHCLHTLKNEYPAFGGNYEVIHHTQLINELVGAGKIQLEVKSEELEVTFHDPCYLGRHNKITDAPREALKNAGMVTVEMPRHGAKSFCCGAGGAQMWKEEEHGTANVNRTRFKEAKATGANTLAVGCPFCMTMLNDASKADGGEVAVKDVAEIVAERLK
ncbi:MAG: 4Fe-4S dicluster domain-containing protein [Anaerolineales bacterium]|nr:4Fe-4S dicluster domain-containing protein [Anaerolineales bacterium]